MDGVDEVDNMLMPEWVTAALLALGPLLGGCNPQKLVIVELNYHEAPHTGATPVPQSQPAR